MKSKEFVAFLKGLAIGINDQMPRFAFEFLKKYYPSFKNLKILLLGVSYRGDVGDTRYSPVEKLYDFLKDENSEISCHDPYVDYWDEKSLDIEQDLKSHLNNSPDIIIITAGHSVYKSKKTIGALNKLNSTFIYDTIGFLSNNQISMLKKKHIIKVLGRGDL